MSNTIIPQTTVKDTRLADLMLQEWTNDTILGYVKERRVPASEFEGTPTGSYLLMEAFDADGERIEAEFEDGHLVDRKTPIGTTFPGEDGVTHVLIGVFGVWGVENNEVILVNHSNIGCPVHDWCEGHTIPNTSFDEIRNEVHMSKSTHFSLGFKDASASFERSQHKDEPEKLGVTIDVEGAFNVTEIRTLAIELDKFAETLIRRGAELLTAQDAVDSLEVVEITNWSYRDRETGLAHLFTRSEDGRIHAVPKVAWDHLDTESERNPKPGDTWFNDPHETGDTSSKSTYIGLYCVAAISTMPDGTTITTFEKEKI